MSRFLAFLLLMFAAHSALAQESAFDAADWETLVSRHVHWVRSGHASEVDYDGMRADRALLSRFLARVASVRRGEFDTWSRDEQLAFLVNLYNAATVDLVLTRYPRLSSIKDLGFLWQSPWKITFVRALGSTYTLDQVEHTLILDSPRFRDPRVHFALNCASKGCPALRPEAYRSATLDGQLEDQVTRFLGDRTRNQLSGTVLMLSPIFRWYQSNFEGGWRDVRTLADFLRRYHAALSLSSQDLADLDSGSLELSWSAYDWSLNASRKRP